MPLPRIYLGRNEHDKLESIECFYGRQLQSHHPLRQYLVLGRPCFPKSSSAEAGALPVRFPAGHKMGCLCARGAIFRVPGHKSVLWRARESCSGRKEHDINCQNSIVSCARKIIAKSMSNSTRSSLPKPPGPWFYVILGLMWLWPMVLLPFVFVWYYPSVALRLLCKSTWWLFAGG